MKRLCIVMMLMLGLSAWAQVPDSTASKGRELDGGQRQHRERNVLGAPVYYDTLGNVIGSEASRQGIPTLPKHHYFNRLSNDFCTWFFEADGWVGGDLAVGASLTYLPERWGFYGKGLLGNRSNYVAVGPVVRLSDCGDWLDWQLYGGLVVSNHLGAEVGVRMALPRRSSSFCWESVSVGVAQMGNRTFLTCGMSMELTAVLSSFFILWW